LSRENLDKNAKVWYNDVMEKNKDCPFCGAPAMQLSDNPQVVAYAPIRGLVHCSNSKCPMVVLNIPSEIWNNRPKEEEMKQTILDLYKDDAEESL
jgi:hypothetical protein